MLDKVLYQRSSGHKIEDEMGDDMDDEMENANNGWNKMRTMEYDMEDEMGEMQMKWCTMEWYI